MRTTSVTQSAAGFSPWVPLNTKQTPFNVSLATTVASGSTLTYSVQHTFDDVQNAQSCSIARSGTTATLTLPNHGLSSTSDSITVIGAGAPFDGTYAPASITNANVFTYTVANSGATASANGAKVVIMRVFDHETIIAKTANDDGNYMFPAYATRLNVTAYTSGNVTLTVNQGK